MKKIWKKRKNSEAVSPVIATILMVAITVVLAAVLYVMVMGFGTTGNQTPTGAFTSATKLTATTYKIQLGAISPDTQFQACKIRVDPALAPTTAVTFTISGTTTLTISPAVPSATAPGIAITDLAADGKISVGDYITVTLDTNHPATDNGEWIITLLFTATGGSIASKTFTVSGN